MHADAVLTPACQPRSALKSSATASDSKKVGITESADQEDIRRMREALQRQLKAVQDADARLKGTRCFVRCAPCCVV